MKEAKLTTAMIIESIEAVEQDRATFNAPDPLLTQIIEAESHRLTQAARTIGNEWNGMFHRGHLLLIARTYHNLSQVVKFRRIRPL